MPAGMPWKMEMQGGDFTQCIRLGLGAVPVSHHPNTRLIGEWLLQGSSRSSTFRLTQGGTLRLFTWGKIQEAGAIPPRPKTSGKTAPPDPKGLDARPARRRRPKLQGAKAKAKSKAKAMFDEEEEEILDGIALQPNLKQLEGRDERTSATQTPKCSALV